MEGKTMTATRLILAVCVLAPALAASGAEPVRIACDPSEALGQGMITISASGTDRTKPAKGSGTVNTHAVVLTLRGPAVPVKVAIDSVKADATAPDVLRLDFSGKGQFAGAPTVPLKAESTGGQYFMATFGPQAIRAVLGGDAVPVIISGEYMKMGNYRSLHMSVGTALQGKANFRQRAASVRIIDGDGDLKLGSAWRASSGRVRPGDTLIIDTGDGSFTKSVVKTCYGSPVEIDGAWYDVRLAKNAKTITATPLKLDLGKVRIDHPKWSCMLVGKKYLLWLSGGPKPVTVPADQYVLVRYEQWGPADAAGRRAHLSCNDLEMGASGKIASVAVTGGKTAEVTIGSPLTASITTARRSGGRLSLSLVLVDASGRRVGDLQMANGKRPPAPKVVVRNADGKQVYTCSLEYG